MSNWEGGNDINEISHISYNQNKESLLLEEPIVKQPFRDL